jgi:hypothetical protein
MGIFNTSEKNIDGCEVFILLGPIKELRVRVLERDGIGLLNFSNRQETPVNVNNFIYLGVKAMDDLGNEEWVDARWYADKGELVHISPVKSSQVRVVGLRPAEDRIAIIAEYGGLKAKGFIQRIGQSNEQMWSPSDSTEQVLLSSTMSSGAWKGKKD